MLGTQKTPYHVQLTRNMLWDGGNNESHMTTCTCIDFSRRHQPCKHIYFVFTQVAKADFLLKPIGEENQMRDNYFIRLDRMLVEKLGQRIH